MIPNSPSLNFHCCRNPEWRRVCGSEQVLVSCWHHPLARHHQEPTFWTSGCALKQQWQHMWVFGWV